METLEKILLILVGLIILSSFLFWAIPIFTEINDYRDYVNDWEEENEQEEQNSSSYNSLFFHLFNQQDQLKHPLKIEIFTSNYIKNDKDA
ncbi:MAG: hypothetical protein ACFFBP_06755 [Promethearchaeota archaeon]